MGIAAINNLCFGSIYSWGLAWWHLIKAGENGLNVQHKGLLIIYLWACALQLALFGMFSKRRGLNSWSKLNKSTDKFEINFKYLITNPCSKVLIQKIEFLKAWKGFVCFPLRISSEMSSNNNKKLFLWQLAALDLLSWGIFGILGVWFVGLLKSPNILIVLLIWCIEHFVGLYQIAEFHLSIITEFWGDLMLCRDIIILKSSAMGVLSLGISSQGVTKGKFRKSDFSSMYHLDHPKSNPNSLNSW